MQPVIKEVKTLKELRTFIRYTKQLYKGNPYYVPTLFMDDYETLRWDRNPAFDHCEAKYWLAYQDGKIVGRVAGIVNKRYQEHWGVNYGRFNWIDFIDDADVSKALLDTVEAWVKTFNVEALHGPLGFTDMDREAMLVEGFDQLGTMVGFYNHPYYREHLEQLGFTKAVDWVEYEITVPKEPVEVISKVAEAAKKRSNLHILKVKKKKDILKYAPQMFAVFNEAYKHLYGVVPLTEKQVALAIKQYFGMIVPDYAPFVINDKDELVGFGITMPSFSHALQKSGGELFPFGFIHLLKAMKKNDRADLYLIGVKEEYRGKGVNAIMMDHIIKVFQRNGITKVESNPELETNSLVQTQWKYFEKRQHKRRRVFIKSMLEG
jgi:ribosomal protein S18 acetylase RimI-like enzyme